MRTHNSLYLQILAFALLLCTSSVSLGEQDPEAVIKFRQGIMKAQGGHMAAMAQIVRGKVNYGDRLTVHANALHSIIGNISELFPEGSDFGETAAKEDIWEQWEQFEKSAKQASEKAQTFLKAVNNGDQATIGSTFKELAKACKACHKDFRQEEE